MDRREGGGIHPNSDDSSSNDNNSNSRKGSGGEGIVECGRDVGDDRYHHSNYNAHDNTGQQQQSSAARSSSRARSHGEEENYGDSIGRIDRERVSKLKRSATTTSTTKKEESSSTSLRRSNRPRNEDDGTTSNTIPGRIRSGSRGGGERSRKSKTAKHIIKYRKTLMQAEAECAVGSDGTNLEMLPPPPSSSSYSGKRAMSHFSRS
eukprot:9587184-Ditylum_brightwellii.AAC.1